MTDTGKTSNLLMIDLNKGCKGFIDKASTEAKKLQLDIEMKKFPGVLDDTWKIEVTGRVVDVKRFEQWLDLI